MTNAQSSTKRALLTSVMALLLCFTMLLGTTFAWFTDEVTSSGNKIQAGTLKIDLLVKNDDGEYKSVKESSEPIFNYDLWEPGYTEVVNVKVANLGTLALQYSLQIITEGFSNADEVKLSDVIDVYYAAEEITLDDRADFDDAVANGDLTLEGTLTDVIFGGAMVKDYLLAGFTTEGEAINPDDSADYATIVLKMQETAGNEYQGLSVGTTFDLKLLATQYTYEKDSFDDQYDADAKFENVIMTMDDLRAAAAKGGSYVLGADLVMSADEAVIPVKNNFVLGMDGHTLDFSAFATRPFEIDEGVSFTLNAKDESIIAGQKGLVNMNNASTLIVNGGNFSGDVASGEIGALIRVASNGKTTIELNNVDYTTTAKAIVISYAGAAEDLNITVNGGNYSTGYIAFYLDGDSNTTIKNATIHGNTVGVYANGTGVEIDNCTITGTAGVNVFGGGLLTIKNSAITASGSYALQVLSTGGTIDVTNTTYNKTAYTSGKVHGADAVIIKDGKEIYRKQAS